MNPLPPLLGHESVRETFVRAVLQNQLPGSILIHGPAGVGRQRLGLWLAQLLLCEEPTTGGACEECVACRLCIRLEHPELHWFFPLARPKGTGSPEQLTAALEKARANELETRRHEPLRPIAPGEPVGIFLAQVQTLRRLASARPSMGGHKVFLIGDAERLVPQESSPEAANALLKVLEEPPPATTFILTAQDPNALLPTLRSRLLPVRLRPLADDHVVRFLVEYAEADESHARSAARLGQGSIGRALGFLPDGKEMGPLEALRQDARNLLGAAAAKGAHRRLAAAHKISPAGARGSFIDTLDFLGLWLRDLGATANGAGEFVVNADDHEALSILAERLPAARSTTPEAIRAVDTARELAYGNVNPQLILHQLLTTLHNTLHGKS